MVTELELHKKELHTIIKEKEVFISGHEQEQTIIDAEVKKNEEQFAAYNEYMDKYQEIMALNLPIDRKMSKIGEISQNYNVEAFFNLEEQHNVLLKRLAEFEKRVSTYDHDLWEFNHIIEWREYEIETLLELICDLEGNET
ncbi:hypothetical protein [Aliivibrio fischeri]|uniref:hypothetical protein n=1 Tax=Aliivibrio fischeri TaxID=668 RepID=UPI0012D8B7FA|nr:hypothetical protein [Aliivibrio fischeri]MUJ20614.1 hypothetical protein [Aliivibrio fischeri]